MTQNYEIDPSLFFINPNHDKLKLNRKMRPDISTARFEQELRNWVAEGYVPLRDLVMCRILRCKSEDGNTLDISGLNLTSIPKAIRFLTDLQVLNLEGNQLTQLPTEIGNMRNLETLLLRRNQLTTVPDSFFLPNRSLDIGNNQIIPSEMKRIVDLAAEKGVRLFKDFGQRRIGSLNRLQYPLQIEASERERFERLSVQISDLSAQISDLSDQDEYVISKIIEKAPEEKRGDLKNFLENDPGLESFRKFLKKSTETITWRVSKEKMIEQLYSLVDKMREDNVFKGTCELIADESFQTCVDRTSYSYLEMLLAQKDLTPIAEMNESQFIEHARQGALIKFLEEQAVNKVNEIREANSGSYREEIEIHLGYHMLGLRRLGLDLPGGEIDMRYSQFVRQCWLDSAATEYESRKNELTAAFMYEHNKLREYGIVDRIIRHFSDRAEEFIVGEKETSLQFRDRVEGAATQVRNSTTEALEAFVKGEWKEELISERQEAPSTIIKTIFFDIFTKMIENKKKEEGGEGR